MEKDSKFLRDADGYIAVRVLPQTEALPATEKDSMFGRDVNGNIGVRVIGVGGGGGGDTHNKGYYATPEDLQEAIPTAEAGDYAIVGSTDTVWVWDTSTSAWVDTDTKGEVSPDMVIIKSLTMPAASTTPAGSVYQYIGTTNANYTHGYIYECVSDGQDPATYSWTRIDVQPAPVIPDPLPDQTGNAGKFLTTDGTDASWGTALANQTTASHSLVVGENATVGTGTNCVAIGYQVNGNANGDNIAIGAYSQAVNSSTALGHQAKATGVDSTAIGYYTQAKGSYSISVGDRAIANGTSITMGRSSQSEDRCLSLGAYAYSRYDSIGIGYGSSTSARTKADYYSIAIGNNAKAENNCIAIGNYQTAGAYSICIGSAANGFSTSSNVVAICAGEQGWTTVGTIPQGCIVLSAVNRSSTTFFDGLKQNNMYVGLGSTLWRVLDGTTGLFAPNRIASTTGLADGTYVLKMTITDGTPTLSWVLES